MLFTRRDYVAICVLVLLICFCLPFGRAYAAKADMSIFVDNVPAFSDVAPYETQGTLLVPTRLIAEELGADVQWDAASQQVRVTGEGVDILLTVGQTNAMVNGESQTLTVAPQMKQGAVVVPLRFIGEALGVGVYHVGGSYVCLYSLDYDELKAQQGIFVNNGDIYSCQNGKIYQRKAGAEYADVLLDKPYVYRLLAVSRTGLLYNYNGEVWHYALADGRKTYVDNVPASLINCQLTGLGRWVYTADSLADKDCLAIYSQNFGDDYQRKLLVEKPHYQIDGLVSYGGYIYYKQRPAVAQPWGYDTYSGAIYRVAYDYYYTSECLTEEHVDAWSVQSDGLHYELNGEEKILPFAEMKDLYNGTEPIIRDK